MIKRKIALFGGTFDPIHLGHTAVAAFAAQHIGAQTAIFIPAKRSVLKALSPHAADRNRLDMISLAIAGNENFQTSDYELNKSGPSYTIETVKHFLAEYGSDVVLHWLIGADSVDDFALWYKIVELIDLCNLSIMYRGGFPAPDLSKYESVWGLERVEKLRQNVISTPLVPVSSTQVRERIAAGLDISYMVHPAVADYIRKHGLYQPRAKS